MTACVELTEPPKPCAVRGIERTKSYEEEERLHMTDTKHDQRSHTLIIIHTHGKMNGYTADKNSIVEGRTWGANYKRILFNDGKREVMTLKAYDIEEPKKNNKGNIINGIPEGKIGVRTWFSREAHSLYNKIMDMRNNAEWPYRMYIFDTAYAETNVIRPFTICCTIYLNARYVKLFNKDEAIAYIKMNPQTEERKFSYDWSVINEEK
jgi:hypothetical protein